MVFYNKINTTKNGSQSSNCDYVILKGWKKRKSSQICIQFQWVLIYHLFLFNEWYFRDRRLYWNAEDDSQTFCSQILLKYVVLTFFRSIRHFTQGIFFMIILVHYSTNITLPKGSENRKTPESMNTKSICSLHNLFQYKNKHPIVPSCV